MLYPQQRPRFEVELISGKRIKGVTYEEATKLFYSHAGSVIRPYGFEAYKAP